MIKNRCFKCFIFILFVIFSLCILCKNNNNDIKEKSKIAFKYSQINDFEELTNKIKSNDKLTLIIYYPESKVLYNGLIDKNYDKKRKQLLNDITLYTNLSNSFNLIFLKHNKYNLVLLKKLKDVMHNPIAILIDNKMKQLFRLTPFFNDKSNLEIINFIKNDIYVKKQMFQYNDIKTFIEESQNLTNENIKHIIKSFIELKLFYNNDFDFVNSLLKNDYLINSFPEKNDFKTDVIIKISKYLAYCNNKYNQAEEYLRPILELKLFKLDTYYDDFLRITLHNSKYLKLSTETNISWDIIVEHFNVYTRYFINTKNDKMLHKLFTNFKDYIKLSGLDYIGIYIITKYLLELSSIELLKNDVKNLLDVILKNNESWKSQLYACSFVSKTYKNLGYPKKALEALELINIKKYKEFNLHINVDETKNLTLTKHEIQRIYLKTSIYLNYNLDNILYKIDKLKNKISDNQYNLLLVEYYYKIGKSNKALSYLSNLYGLQFCDIKKRYLSREIKNNNLINHF